jgi:probable HAF family extracellular repeat protein
MTDLGTLPGAVQTIVGGINNQGQIVGSSHDGTKWSAFLYDGGTMLNLNDLIDPDSGWTLSMAHGINERGEIIGEGHGTTFLLTPCSSACAPSPPRPVR